MTLDPAYTPVVESWQALCRPAAFDTLLADDRPRPGYDLCAYLANRAAQAYDDDHQRREVIRAEGGLDAQTFGCWTDSAYAYRRGNVGVVVFRGTIWWNLPQWFHSNLFMLPFGVPLRHAGFSLAWRRMRRPVRAWLTARLPPGAEVMIAGHSLGGAMALLAAHELAADYAVRAVVTIGAPRVGLWSFCQEYGSTPVRGVATARRLTLGDVTRRLTHQDDIVSRIPPPLLFDHIGEASRLEPDGTLRIGESRTTLGRLKGAADEAADATHARATAWMNAATAPPPSVFGARPVVTGGGPAVRPEGIWTPIHPVLLPGVERQPTGIARASTLIGRIPEPFRSLFATSAPMRWLAGVLAAFSAVAILVMALFDGKAHGAAGYRRAFQEGYRRRMAPRYRS